MLSFPAMSTTPITFTTTSGKSATAELARPPAGGASAAVIVIHEWYGLNDDMRRICGRFAAEGFAALAIDLYGGRSTADDAEAMQLVNELRTADAIEIVRAAAEHLRSIGARKIGVTGFCLGGAMALAAACNVEGLSAVVPFYGTPKEEFLDLSRAKAPILGHYGRNDPIIPIARVEAIEARGRDAGATITLERYDAGHAFMREGSSAYVEEAAKLAWARTVAFFREQLSA